MDRRADESMKAAFDLESFCVEHKNGKLDDLLWVWSRALVACRLEVKDEQIVKSLRPELPLRFGDEQLWNRWRARCLGELEVS